MNTLKRAKEHRIRSAAGLVIACVGLAVLTVIGIVGSRRTVNDAPNIVQRQLTANPVNDSVYTVAISDDARQVAYTDLRGVHVRLLDTGEVHDVSVPEQFCFR